MSGKIYIYGSSGHGLVVADVAAAVGYDETVFLDDKGELKFSASLPKADIIIAIGNNKIRQILQKRVQEAGFNIATLIHPSAIISPSATVGSGVVIMPQVVVNARAFIGSGVILNTSCVIEHENFIGEFAHISPNAALAGNVKVGECSHVGIGASVKQGVSIGANSIIGAGSVVVSDIDSNSLAYGVPARKMRENKI